MRRALVLTDESARHWFRQMLPPRREIIIDPVPMGDRQLFMVTFIAGFLAFSGFLA